MENSSIGQFLLCFHGVERPRAPQMTEQLKVIMSFNTHRWMVIGHIWPPAFQCRRDLTDSQKTVVQVSIYEYKSEPVGYEIHCIKMYI